ncbi:MAG TPA: NUDIX domain-containing protein [Anaerolineales bacterium]|nr:NUDIX domain-containing protein [Anaerolineales bacterium]
MHILTEIYRGEGVNIHGKTIHRTAVRAVIWRGKDLLMVYSAKVGDYKFPGGGVDAGETHEQTLARELREECGVSLVRVDGELGAIVEYNFPTERDFDVFKMTSHYYFCRIESGSFNAQKLDGYEEALGFTPVWVDVDIASQKNRQLLDSRKPPDWLKREIFALEYLKQNLFK